MKQGFIGLGVMGRPMALHLMQHELGMAAPAASLVMQSINALMGRGLGQSDLSVLIEVVESMSPALSVAGTGLHY